ncbi:MAG TPA: hypothetical protein PKA20_22695, partial [Burkholderiaceae bacterium]|nr:hypothetical protein [Burkholderiaceae bacterium]
MDPRPSYRVGAAGLDPRDWRLIEIVFKHSQYNRYEFTLIEDLSATPVDILIVNTTDSAAVKVAAGIRASGRAVPIIAAVPRGAPSAARHAISIDRLTLQLLPILNRVVELELSSRQDGQAAGFAPTATMLHTETGGTTADTGSLPAAAGGAPSTSSATSQPSAASAASAFASASADGRSGVPGAAPGAAPPPASGYPRGPLPEAAAAPAGGPGLAAALSGAMRAEAMPSGAVPSGAAPSGAVPSGGALPGGAPSGATAAASDGGGSPSGMAAFPGGAGAAAGPAGDTPPAPRPAESGG